MPGPHRSRDEGLACKDCPAPPNKGRRRCENCAKLHNAREQARRAERKRRRLCHVCGAKVVKDDAGNLLTTCAVHREYFAARSRAELGPPPLPPPPPRPGIARPPRRKR
jgi:hypothetical protein